MNSRKHNNGKTDNPYPDAFHRLGTARRGNPHRDEALLEMAQDFRGTLLLPETSDKIAARILGSKDNGGEPPIGHWEQHEQN